MTLDELRTRVYFLADEVPSGVFPQARIDSLINSGIKRVAQAVRYRTTQTIATVDGTQTYALTSPLLERGAATVFSVRYDGRVIQKRVVDSFNIPTLTGTPTAYWVAGGSVCLWPIPNEVKTLSVDYVTEPASLTAASDVAPLTDLECEVVALYAVWQMKSKDDEYNRSDRLRDEFERELSRLRGPRAGVYKG